MVGGQGLEIISSSGEVGKGVFGLSEKLRDKGDKVTSKLGTLEVPPGEGAIWRSESEGTGVKRFLPKGNWRRKSSTKFGTVFRRIGTGTDEVIYHRHLAS